MKTVLERFHEKYDIDEETQCWIWNRTPQSKGYPTFEKMGGHVWSYITFVGEIPEGHVVNHMCHDWDGDCHLSIGCPHRKCVNPSHLEAVTHRENIMSSGSKSISKINAEKTHCVHGHELTGRNLMIKKKGKAGTQRQCRTCQSATQRRWEAKKKAASSVDSVAPQG